MASNSAGGSTQLEVVESMNLSEDAAEEVAGELTEPLGLVRDLTYTGGFLVVRWPEESDADE